MTTTITCPHCSKPLEVTEALISHIQKDLVERHEKELASVARQTEQKLREEMAKEEGKKLENLTRELEEKTKKIEEMREAELRLLEQKRKIEERGKELELEVARKIDQERKRIEEQVAKKSYEEHRLKDQEKDKKLQDALRMNEELRRKLEQGSQQTQGEVQELDLEETLARLFPHDTIEPVGKGVRGADVRQIVKSRMGKHCGVILWESKRTKAWTDDWIGKLKTDLRAEQANIPVIVSTTLPKDAETSIVLRHGVWIASFAMLEPLARLLRKNLIEVAYQKHVNEQKGDKADLLYQFVTGHEFRQQIEALAEVHREMREQISKERAAYERLWKRRESQLERFITSTAGLYGSMQGLVGSSLPTVKGLDLGIEDEVEESPALK